MRVSGVRTISSVRSVSLPDTDSSGAFIEPYITWPRASAEKTDATLTPEVDGTNDLPHGSQTFEPLHYTSNAAHGESHRVT